MEQRQKDCWVLQHEFQVQEETLGIVGVTEEVTHYLILASVHTEVCTTAYVHTMDTQRLCVVAHTYNPIYLFNYIFT